MKAKHMGKCVSVILLMAFLCFGSVFFSACDSGSKTNVTLEPLSGWTFNQGDSLRDGQVSSFKATYYKTYFDNATHKYVTEKEPSTVNSLVEAMELGLVAQNLITSTAGTRTMTVVWMGEFFTVEYTVS